MLGWPSFPASAWDPGTSRLCYQWPLAWKVCEAVPVEGLHSLPNLEGTHRSSGMAMTLSPSLSRTHGLELTSPLPDMRKLSLLHLSCMGTATVPTGGAPSSHPKPCLHVRASLF